MSQTTIRVRTRDLPDPETLRLISRARNAKATTRDVAPRPAEFRPAPGSTHLGAGPVFAMEASPRRGAQLDLRAQPGPLPNATVADVRKPYGAGATLDLSQMGGTAPGTFALAAERAATGKVIAAINERNRAQFGPKA